MDTDIGVRQDEPKDTERTTTRRHGPLLWAAAVFACGVLALLLIQRKYAMPFTDERTLARLIEETRA